MPVDHALKSSWEDESSELPVGIGDVLDGKYRIVRVLGKGGMGVVMGAVHVELGHRIALKFLSREGARNDETLARFALEAKAVALMRSEHATRILDIGRLPSGEPYMVLEMLEGADLGAIVQKRGPLPITDAVAYVLEACEAIAEAHALGIVHRDLKPDNLFLATRPDGTKIVKVLDFGISKFSSLGNDDLGPAPALTTTSAIIGSPIYMSPEQLKSTRDVDTRTDIWSIGVALYELIAGQPPFPWRNMAELSAAILKDTPPLLSSRNPDVPPELDAVIMRCLEKNADDRFENIAELAWALVPFGGLQAARSAEKASELLARTSVLNKKCHDQNLLMRQGLDTQTDPVALAQEKVIASPIGATHPAEELSTTKDLHSLTYSLTMPVLRGLPFAALFFGILVVILIIAHFRHDPNATVIAEAHRGIAGTMSTRMASIDLPKTPNAKEVTTKPKGSPTIVPETPMPKPAESKATSPVHQEKPHGIVTRKPPRIQRRNPYADRE